MLTFTAAVVDGDHEQVAQIRRKRVREQLLRAIAEFTPDERNACQRALGVSPGAWKYRPMIKDQAAAAAAVRVTRAAALFDRIISTLLGPAAHGLSQGDRAAPDTAAPHDRTAPDTAAPHDRVELAEKAELRERLDAFFPEFRQLYGGLLVKHIGQQSLPAVLAALDSDAVQLYFRALQAMEPELLRGLQSLTKRMAIVAADRGHG